MSKIAQKSIKMPRIQKLPKKHRVTRTLCQTRNRRCQPPPTDRRKPSAVSPPPRGSPRLLQTCGATPSAEEHGRPRHRYAAQRPSCDSDGFLNAQLPFGAAGDSPSSPPPSRCSRLDSSAQPPHPKIQFSLFRCSWKVLIFYFIFVKHTSFLQKSVSDLLEKLGKNINCEFSTNRPKRQTSKYSNFHGNPPQFSYKISHINTWYNNIIHQYTIYSIKTI